MDAEENRWITEALSQAALDELPGLLRGIATEVEEKQRFRDEALREAVLDFERGLVSLPELLAIAKESK